MRILGVGLGLPVLAAAQGMVLSEGPVKYRLYQRDAENRCRVEIRGTLPASADRVVLTIARNGSVAESLGVAGPATFAFAPMVTAGLTQHRFDLEARAGNAPVGSLRIDSVLCGDAYVIYGQSNAEAFSGWGAYTGSDGQRYRSGFVRSYQGSWAVPNARQTGVWGMHLARQIVEKHGIPVAIVNAAKGNTTILHLSPDYVVPVTETEWYEDTKAYGNFYRRLTGWVKEAGLTAGIRAILWHQGERNVYGSNFTEYKLYDYGDAFRELRKSFYRDFPALKKIFTFQIKTGCGGDNIGWNIIFETQRRLAQEFADVEIVSTLAPDMVGCHYSDDRGVVGYTKIGGWVWRQVDSVFYGGRYPYPLTPPDLILAAYTSSRKDEVALVFDQDILWTDSLVYDPTNPVHIQHFPNRTAIPVPALYSKTLFAFDSTTLGQVVSGRSEGRKVFLKLKGPSAFRKIAYVRYDLPGTWPGPFLTGPQNGMGALGFYVPIDDVLPVPVRDPLGLGPVVPDDRRSGPVDLLGRRVPSRAPTWTLRGLP